MLVRWGEFVQCARVLESWVDTGVKPSSVTMVALLAHKSEGTFVASAHNGDSCAPRADVPVLPHTL